MRFVAEGHLSCAFRFGIGPERRVGADILRTSMSAILKAG